MLRWLTWIVRGLLLTLLVGVIAVTAYEMRSFRFQSEWFAGLTAGADYGLGSGPGRGIVYPEDGEWDRRLGYTRLPAMLERLTARGYRIDAQATWTPQLTRLADWGAFVPYDRKHHAGLEMTDQDGRRLHGARYPERGYARFDDIPAVVVATLLYIENQSLLDDDPAARNPAVEWKRLALSLGTMGMHLVGRDMDVHGASTLATQIEKYRHSPGGRTDGVEEKARQMLSASLRAYRHGTDTRAARRALVTEYVNTVPLAAVPGFGEVHGLGDGLWAWFGADLDEVNARLADPDSPAAGAAYRQVLSLLIAQRRPSDLLRQRQAELETLTDSYLRLLARDGVIGGSLYEQAAAAELRWQPGTRPQPPPFTERKWPYFVRARLTETLGVGSLYELDRLDMSVATTIDGEAQARTARLLARLGDPAEVQTLRLIGQGLLERGDPAGVRYSVTIMERGPQANRIRVQADNIDGPFDLNRGAKLDLGSTAKLRTLVTYLDVLAALHGRYAALGRAELLAESLRRRDALGLWVIDQLRAHPGLPLITLLESGMRRVYSANPGERFFTGGGRHEFSNFDSEDDQRFLTVAEAFDRSVNLVFVRMMRDLVAYYQAEMPYSTERLLEQADSPERRAYLERFADQEGTEFLRRFHAQYSGADGEAVMARLVQRARVTPNALATLAASLDPEAALPLLRRLWDDYLPDRPRPADPELGALIAAVAPARMSLVDRAYIARVHPLELWLAGHLRQQPAAPLQDVIDASRDVRLDAYHWLFRTQRRRAQDRRIATLLEQEAFLDIHAQWARLGYPFDAIVPSLASALGSAADQPAALAELLGIIVNDGVRLPTRAVEHLRFAAATPWEVALGHGDAAPERVLPAEVAAVTRQALRGVVMEGTARRLQWTASRWAGAIGGKTGTGDHRFEQRDARGRLIESRVVNRAAVFTFTLGDRYFGTVTAFVPGRAAAGYGFTSALPVHVLGLVLAEIEDQLWLAEGTVTGQHTEITSGG
ncbi:MAG: transglycosylase domain-containing protein [Pseudomonadales bacterium]